MKRGNYQGDQPYPGQETLPGLGGDVAPPEIPPASDDPTAIVTEKIRAARYPSELTGAGMGAQIARAALRGADVDTLLRERDARLRTLTVQKGEPSDTIASEPRAHDCRERQLNDP